VPTAAPRCCLPKTIQAGFSKSAVNHFFTHRLSLNEGFVAKVVFPSGVVEEDDRLLIYYGASDKYCAMAEISRRDVMNGLH